MAVVCWLYHVAAHLFTSVMGVPGKNANMQAELPRYTYLLLHAALENCQHPTADTVGHDLAGASCHTKGCQHHVVDTIEHSNPRLAAAQLPYSLPTGNPAPGLTEVMSGLSREANCPAVQVKPSDVSEVSSARSSGTFCRLGVGSTKSWATTYTLYNVPAVIPHDPAWAQCE